MGLNAVSGGAHSVALGHNSRANANEGIAFGNGASADREAQVSIGSSAGSIGNRFGVSIGQNAGAGSVTADAAEQATWRDNVAVGAKSRYSAEGTDNTALGSYAGNNLVGDENVTVGHSAMMWGEGNYNTALGNSAGLGYKGDFSAMLGFQAGNNAEGNENSFFGNAAGQKSAGEYNVMVGSMAGESVKGSSNVFVGALSGNLDPNDTTEGATTLGVRTRAGNNGTALGFGAISQIDNGVALGANSVMDQTLATTAAALTSTSASQTDYITATLPTVAGISIGNAANGEFRQIHNLAAGTLDTDAVNVAQLRTVDESLAAQITRIDQIGQQNQAGVQYAWDDANNNNLMDAGEIDYTRVMVGKGNDDAVLEQVAAGEISAASRQGINGAQIFANQQSLADHLGGSAYGVNVNPDGTLSAPSYGLSTIDANGNSSSTNYTNVGDALSGMNASLLNVNTNLQDVDNRVTNVDNRLTTLEANPGAAVDALLWDAGEEVYSAARSGEDNKITGVAAGLIDAASNEAVNGSQIHANQQSIADIFGGSAYGVNMNADGTLSLPAFVISSLNASGAASNVTYNNVGDALGGLNTSLLSVNTRLTTLENKPIIPIPEPQPNPNIPDPRVTLIERRIETLETRVVENTGGNPNAVTYQTDAAGKRTNTIALLGGDPNAPVVISNVAAGVADTDAVNVGQFNAGLADTLSAANTYSDQVGQRTLQQANSYTDSMISNLNNTIGDVRGEARQAAAIGLAASSLRFAETPGATSVAVGAGAWQGEGAIAIGLGYTTQDNRFRSNATLTSAGGEVGIGGGLSWTIGGR